MIKKILIANRGEIAVRIIRTCKIMNILSVVIYSEIDKGSLHVQLADEAYCIGGPHAQDSYLNMEKILKIAIKSSSDAIHPGYGFLSENYKFAHLIESHGIIFIGPRAYSIKQMGNKNKAREIMIDAEVPVIPGTKVLNSIDSAVVESSKLTFPLMMKASAGGGGRGINYITSSNDIYKSFKKTQDEAFKAFGNKDIYFEEYISSSKHIEMQVLVDIYNNIMIFPERECSLQRNNQKVIEESPSCFISNEIRMKLVETAIKVVKAVNYIGAGTIEFLMDKKNNFYFMEMNTRIQVEHPVTEMITNIDIIELQIKIADKQSIKLYSNKDINYNGNAIEARIYAENLLNNKFIPSSGIINYLHLPGGPFIRVDSGIHHNTNVTSYYDGLLIKIISWGHTRNIAIKRLIIALQETTIVGCQTNIPFLIKLLKEQNVQLGTYDTCSIDKMIEKDERSESKMYIVNAIISASIQQILSKLQINNNSNIGWQYSYYKNK